MGQCCSASGFYDKDGGSAYVGFVCDKEGGRTRFAKEEGYNTCGSFFIGETKIFFNKCLDNKTNSYTEYCDAFGVKCYKVKFMGSIYDPLAIKCGWGSDIKPYYSMSGLKCVGQYVNASKPDPS